MSHTFTIKTENGLVTEEPIVGKWYAGFTTEQNYDDGSSYELDGALAEYVGDGQFCDEDYQEAGDTDMTGYDYLILQH